MQIDLTPEQYRALVLLTCLGEWVVNAHRTEPEKTFRDLLLHLCASAREFGVEDLAEDTEGTGEWHPSAEVDEAVREYIEDYDDLTFWEELAERLALRDLIAEHGEKAIQRMDREEVMAAINVQERRYQEEFEAFGLDRLQVG